MSPLRQSTALPARPDAIPIPPAYAEGVAAQAALTEHLVAPLLAFDLPDDVPPAPIFRP